MVQFGFYSFGSQRLIDFISTMKRVGLPYFTNPIESLPFFGQNSGLIIFSSYPLLECKQMLFTKSNEIVNNKGYISAFVSIIVEETLPVKSEIQSQVPFPPPLPTVIDFKKHPVPLQRTIYFKKYLYRGQFIQKVRSIFT